MRIEELMIAVATIGPPFSHSAMRPVLELVLLRISQVLAPARIFRIHGETITNPVSITDLPPEINESRCNGMIRILSFDAMQLVGCRVPADSPHGRSGRMCVMAQGNGKNRQEGDMERKFADFDRMIAEAKKAAIKAVLVPSP